MVQVHEMEAHIEKEGQEAKLEALTNAASIEDKLHQEDIQRQSISGLKKTALPTFRPSIAMTPMSPLPHSNSPTIQAPDDTGLENSEGEPSTYKMNLKIF